MASWNGNIFQVTGHLCGEFTGPQRPVTRALVFSLICVWINGWVNNREAGDLRRHRAHYDVIVMMAIKSAFQCECDVILLIMTSNNVRKWNNILKRKILTKFFKVQTDTHRDQVSPTLGVCFCEEKVSRISINFALNWGWLKYDIYPFDVIYFINPYISKCASIEILELGFASFEI